MADGTSGYLRKKPALKRLGYEPRNDSVYITENIFHRMRWAAQDMENLEQFMNHAIQREIELFSKSYEKYIRKLVDWEISERELRKQRNKRDRERRKAAKDELLLRA